ncbi:30S ribosomal protein S16 [Candidatus Dojkabacteria bacterium]|nr:30S ribosomal protein S16 [Candidatus Dojkabacteria bacterium]
MLKIRLQRRGKRGDAHYRVVVIESHRPRDSKFIEDLGYYNPHQKPSKLNIDMELTKSWLEKGAQPTDTVAQFLHKEGVLDDWRKTKHSKLPQKKAKKKEQEEAPKDSAEANSNESAEKKEEAPKDTAEANSGEAAEKKEEASPKKDTSSKEESKDKSEDTTQPKASDDNKKEKASSEDKDDNKEDVKEDK